MAAQCDYYGPSVPQALVAAGADMSIQDINVSCCFVQFICLLPYSCHAAAELDCCLAWVLLSDRHVRHEYILSLRVICI